MSRRLNLDMDGRLVLTDEVLVGKSIAILGITGSGKSNTIKVLLHETLASIPAMIVDLDGEYHGLKERLGVLMVGPSLKANLAVKVEQAEALAKLAMEQEVSLILDFGEVSHDKHDACLLAYTQRLWANPRAQYPHVMYRAILPCERKQVEEIVPTLACGAAVVMLDGATAAPALTISRLADGKLLVRLKALVGSYGREP